MDAEVVAVDEQNNHILPFFEVQTASNLKTQLKIIIFDVLQIEQLNTAFQSQQQRYSLLQQIVTVCINHCRKSALQLIR